MLPRPLCATETVATPAPDAAVEAGALVVVAVLCGEAEPLVVAELVVLLPPPQPASQREQAGGAEGAEDAGFRSVHVGLLPGR